MSQVIRVLVVDDSAYVRKVVKQMLSRSPFIEVVGTARDGRDAMEQVAALQPDVSILITYEEGANLLSALVAAGLDPATMIGLDAFFAPRRRRGRATP